MGSGDSAAATATAAYKTSMLTRIPSATTHKKTAASPSSNPPKSTSLPPPPLTYPSAKHQTYPTHPTAALFWYAILESLGIIAMAMYVLPFFPDRISPEADMRCRWRVLACRCTSSKHSSPKPAGGTRCRLRARLRAAPCIYDYWPLHIHEITHPPTHMLKGDP